MADQDSQPHATFKFPPFQPDLLPTPEEEPYAFSSSRTASPSRPVRQTGGPLGTDRWQPRRESRQGATRHARQKSLGEAIRTVRTRGGSVSENVHEIAESLKAPLSWRLIFLCGAWYASSISSNTSSKAILNALPNGAVTLTLVQFAFVSGSCLFLAALARRFPRLKHYVPVLKFGIRKPTRDLLRTTLPLALFQVGGHILSSASMGRISVALVHTIKGLSPLMTVFAYRFFLGIQYSIPTYLSLIPLTAGVVLVCSADFNANFTGLLFAFLSAILFVTQNIISKQIFNESAAAERDAAFGIATTRFSKPDKLNLLCYSSGMAFLFTLPLWLWSEGFHLIWDFLSDASISLSNRPGSFDHGRLLLEFVFNGIVHFGQNIVAFILLSMVSPVTYSVASLLKRVFVIVFAILWYGKPMTGTQGAGFLLTFFGLYLYDRTSDAAKADKRVRNLQARGQASVLPLTAAADNNKLPVLGEFTASPAAMGGDGGGGYMNGNGYGYGNGNGYMNGTGYGFPSANGSSAAMMEQRDTKKSDGHLPNNAPTWLPPGTKQEETWRPPSSRGPGGAVSVS